MPTESVVQPQRSQVLSVLLLAMAGVVLIGCVGHRAPRDDDERTAPSSSECGERRMATEAEYHRCAFVEVPEIQVDGGSDRPVHTLQVLLDVAEKYGAEVVLDDATRRRLAKAMLFICGVHRIRRSEVIEWLTAVLSYSNVTIVTLEADMTNARPRWTCIERRAPSAPSAPRGL